MVNYSKQGQFESLKRMPATVSLISSAHFRSYRSLALQQFLSHPLQALLLLVDPRHISQDCVLEQLDQQTQRQKVICQQATHLSKPNVLLEWLAPYIDAATPNPSRQSETLLNGFITQLLQQKQPLTLIVTNAHLLPFETLAALSHLAIQQEKTAVVLKIILVGDALLVEKAESLQTQAIPKISFDDDQIILDKPAIKENFWHKHRVKSTALSALFLLGVGMHYFYHSYNRLKPLPRHTPLTSLPPAQSTSSALPTFSPTAKNFTVQLAAFKKFVTATRYIHQYRLAQAQIRLHTANGSSWFVVDNGKFASFKQAANSITTLPEKIRLHHPWVHSFK